MRAIADSKLNKNITFTLLGQDKVSRIHEASLFLLEKVGMKIQGNRMLCLLNDHGLCADSNGLVKFSREVVEHALDKAPKELSLYSRTGKPVLKISDRHEQYFGTHADQLEILDPVSGKARSFQKSDIKSMCKIASFLPNIQFILSVGMASDVRPEIQSQVSFIETVKNFDKTINFSTNDVEGLQDIIDIAATVAGGLTKLQEKPFVFFYCEPIPPLTHPEASTEKLYIVASNRLPVVYMPYCMMGGTAVMSFGGALAQCNAEVLAGLVMTQLVSEGTPFIYGAMPSIFDMKTTIGSYGAPEFHMQVAAASELAAHYKLPFYGTAGCSDAKFIDEQAIAEVTMELMSTILSRANLVHDVGVMDHCNSVSPEMVVFVDEMISGLRVYERGIDLGDLPEALDVIAKVGPGSHFLSEEHTLQNFKKVWYPALLSREMKNKDASAVREIIRGKIRHIEENYQVPALSEDLIRVLNEYELGLLRRLKA
jgi:trimethylamine---corrinoid protein Co-methyltransferase